MILPKRSILLIAGLLIIIGPILAILFQINYWESINWNLISISIERTILSIVVNVSYLALLFLTKNRHKSLWLLGLIWLAFNTFTLLKIYNYI